MESKREKKLFFFPPSLLKLNILIHILNMIIFLYDVKILRESFRRRRDNPHYPEINIDIIGSSLCISTLRS